MYFLSEFPDEQYLIRFNRMNYKGVCGIAGDGHEVYMDNASGVNPQYGDAWYCNLLRKDTETNYFYIANPVYKVEDRNRPLVDITTPDTTITSESIADAPEKECAIAIENEELEEFNKELVGFVAIGDDTIYSPRLTATRYTVYRSFNGDRFEIIPDVNGNIPCDRNSISLESLDDILDCEFPIRLDCTMKDDRILLNLTH